MMSNLLGRINMILHCSFGECRRPVIVIWRSLACQLTAMMNPHLVCIHIEHMAPCELPVGNKDNEVG